MSPLSFANAALLLGLMQLPGLAAGWNPKLAADYLDARQKAWAAWPAAAAPGGTCFSCHTGMTYLLVRPELRRVLGEGEATPFEKALLDGLRSRVGRKDSSDWYPPFTKEPLSSEALGVEAIFAALFLHSEEALDRMWALQIREGKAKGSWSWFQLDLDPWETTDSPFYGATVAALALGAMPSTYRDRPQIRERIAALTGYLQRERPSQPLHNRLMLLWSATVLPEVLPESSRRQLIEEVLKKQQADGGWTVESLGPWKPRPQAPVTTGSSAYATGFAAFVLGKGGVNDPRLTRALEWLRANQNSQGYWEATSMNKHFPRGSMQDLFMRDAATGFAALALVEGARQ